MSWATSGIWFLGLSLAFVLLVEVIRGGLGRFIRRSRAQRRARRARSGELEAEELLVDRGYQVLERQPRRQMSLEVDGQPHVVELRADLLVRKRGRILVAEVKTGGQAPRIETRATRRQLLEYRVGYDDADGVLLVDMNAGVVHEIVFPIPSRSFRAQISAALGGALAGVVIGAICVWFLLTRAG